jgi:hypothetical protein
MNGRFVFRFVLALILLAALVGVGVAVYNVGVTQGLATSGKLVLPAAPGGVVPSYPYAYGPLFHPWGFGFGFGIFGLIFPILFFFLIISLIRGLFFHGGGRWHGGGFRGYGENDVPPMMEEWHRRMHEKSAGQAGTGESKPQ